MPLGRTLGAGHALVTAGRLQRLFFALKYLSHLQVAENRHSSIKHSFLYINVLSPEYAQISGRDCTHMLFQNIQTFYSASEMSFILRSKALSRHLTLLCAQAGAPQVPPLPEPPLTWNPLSDSLAGSPWKLKQHLLPRCSNVAN